MFLGWGATLFVVPPCAASICLGGSKGGWLLSGEGVTYLASEVLGIRQWLGVGACARPSVAPSSESTSTVACNVSSFMTHTEVDEPSHGSGSGAVRSMRVRVCAPHSGLAGGPTPHQSFAPDFIMRMCF